MSTSTTSTKRGGGTIVLSMVLRPVYVCVCKQTSRSGYLCTEGCIRVVLSRIVDFLTIGMNFLLTEVKEWE